MKYCVYEVLPTGEVSETEIRISAGTPEEAARLALGHQLVRSGHKSKLRAKVYSLNSVDGGGRTMVRLYEGGLRSRRWQ